MTRYRLLRRVACGCALSLVLVSLAWSAQYYRYQDNDGKVVLSLTIPPEFVPKGYDVLNEKGRLVKRVAPALTPEQIAARDAELERQRQLQLAQERQAEADAQLRQLYSHPDDAVRVMSRQASEIIDVIQLERGKIEFAQKEIRTLEERAANLQRKGMAVPDKIDAGIQRLNKEIENSLADIAERESDYTRVLGEFEQTIKRLEIITKKSATTYASTLQSLQEKKQKVK